MLIGRPDHFQRSHYEAHKGVAPPDLAELVVHCLELVAQLSETTLPFRFKGGNSQLVLLETPERFSIDVDIVTTVEKERLTEVVTSIVERCPRFTELEVRPHKTKPWLPILSFRVFFDSIYPSPDHPSGERPCVILDAVLEPPPYGGVVKSVRCGDMYQSDLTVELPTISGLLADKMLCIGPSTVGIPLGKNKEAHRLKHVFDVANLSRHEPDWDEVEVALAACLAQENEIQKTAYSFEEVADDTVRFCEDILAHDTLPPVESLEPGTYLDEIVRGFPGVGAFLFRQAYTWELMRRDARHVIDSLDVLRARAAGRTT